MKNGYGLEQDRYEELINKFYGFDEYYFYQRKEYHEDYKFVMNLIDDIRNNKPMDTAYKNAIIGYWLMNNTLQHKHRFRFNELEISITNQCQLDCKHCYNKKDAKHMTLDEYRVICERFYQYTQDFYKPNKHKIYHITGGEPTINPELVDIIRWNNENNCTTYLYTNGIYIDDDIIYTLKENTSNKVFVSIDGTKEINDYIRGDDMFDHAINTVIHLLECDIDTTVICTVNTYNYKVVDKLKIYIESLGCKFITKNYFPLYNNYDIQSLNKTQYNESLYEFSDINEYNIGYVTPYGDYRFSPVCCDIANLLTDTKEIWIEKIKKEYIRFFSLPIQCFNCLLINSCFGGRKNTREFPLYNIEDIDCHLQDRKIYGENITI